MCNDFDQHDDDDEALNQMIVHTHGVKGPHQPLENGASPSSKSHGHHTKLLTT